MSKNLFYGGLTKLDVAGKPDNTMVVDRLWYKFPVGSEFTAFFGWARIVKSLA